MQRVERKKKKSWTHWRLVIVIAATVLLAGSIAAARFLPRKQQEEEIQGEKAAWAPETEENGGSLQKHTAGELDSVTITQRGEEAWTLTRDEAGGMRLKGADGWTVNSRLAERIQDAVGNLVYADILTEDPAEYRGRLAEFGLEDPYIIAEARFTDGEIVTLRLGDEMGIEEGWRYMTVDGDDRLFAVSAALAEDLDIEKEMLHPVTQPEIYSVLLDRITVTGRDGEEREWRLRGAITDPDADTSWEITAPFRYPADEEIIQNLKTSAENLRMGIFLEDATEENLALRELAEPEYTLELHMAAGSTGTVSDLGVYDVVERDGGTVVLEVSRSENEMIDYVRFGDEIFSVSHLTMAAFLDTDPAETAARYIAAVPLNSLESMTVEDGGKIVVYELEHTGESDPETAKEKIICRRNGEAFDYESFAAAYERLLTVTVSGRLPENAEWKEAHTKYTFRTVSGGTHTVSLSDWDGMHDAVTVDGETRFYLIKRGAEFNLLQ